MVDVEEEGEEELTEGERTEEEQTVDGFIDDEAEEGSEEEDGDETEEEEEEEESRSDEEWVPEADEDDADDLLDGTLDKATPRSAKKSRGSTVRESPGKGALLTCCGIDALRQLTDLTSFFVQERSQYSLSTSHQRR